MGEVDVQMAHAVPGVGDVGERAVHRRAPCAHVGAELQQRGRLAQPIGAQAVWVDDLVGDVAVRPRLAPGQEHADRYRRCEKHSEGDERSDQGHSRSG
jgi:hypothetical protein